MATEQYSIGYEEGYQTGWNAAMEAKPEQPAQQEPVAFFVDGDLYYPEEIDWETLQEQGHTVAALYTSPPAQRKPLTDEQIDRLWSQSLADTESETWLPLREFARAIEAKLKEKNT